MWNNEIFAANLVDKEFIFTKYKEHLLVNKVVESFTEYTSNPEK
jgi:hypothetical protein